jgi:hypothetical protein
MSKIPRHLILDQSGLEIGTIKIKGHFLVLPATTYSEHHASVFLKVNDV